MCSNVLSYEARDLRDLSVVQYRRIHLLPKSPVSNIQSDQSLNAISSRWLYSHIDQPGTLEDRAAFAKELPSVPLGMSKIHLESSDSASSDWLVVDVLLREEPDDEDDEEEDEDGHGIGNDEGDDDDVDDDEGYSE